MGKFPKSPELSAFPEEEKPQVEPSVAAEQSSVESDRQLGQDLKKLDLEIRGLFDSFFRREQAAGEIYDRILNRDLFSSDKWLPYQPNREPEKIVDYHAEIDRMAKQHTDPEKILDYLRVVHPDALTYEIEQYPELDMRQVAAYLLSREDMLDPLSDNLPIFLPYLDRQAVVKRYVQTGHISYVMPHIKELSQELVISELLAKNDLEAIAGNIEYFENLPPEVARAWISSGWNGDKILEYLEKFSSTSQNQAVEMMLDAGQDDTVVEHLDDLYELEAQIAYKLVEKGRAREVLSNLNHFDDVDDNVLAQKIIDAGGIGILAGWLDDFSNLSLDLADTLINRDFTSQVIYNWDSFGEGDQEVMIEKLIAAGKQQEIANNLGSFSNLDPKLLPDFFDLNQSETIANIDSFRDVDLAGFSSRLWDSDDYYLLAENTEAFENINLTELAERMLKDGYVTELIDNLYSFSGLSASVAETLVASHPEDVSRHLEAFAPFDHNKLATVLIDRDLTFRLYIDLYKYKGLDPATAELLIESGYGGYVAESLNSFADLDRKAIADLLKKRGELGTLAEHIKEFPSVDQQKLADDVVKATGMDGYRIREFTGWLSDFHGLSEDLFNRFCDAAEPPVLSKVVANLSAFDVSPEQAAKSLLHKGKVPFIILHQDKFRGVSQAIHEEIKEGFLKMYPEDQWASLHDIDKRIFPAWQEFACSFDPPLNKQLKISREIFGPEADAFCYLQVKSLSNGELTDELAKLGIRRTGEKGLLDLRQAVGKIRQSLLSEQIDQNVISESVLAGKIIKELVRYNIDQWSDHSEQTFKRTVKKHFDYKMKNELAPLNPAFVPSDIIRVATVDHEAQEEFTYSESFKYKFSAVLGDLKKAWQVVEENQGMAGLFDEAEKIRQDKLASYREKLPHTSNEKARQNITDRIRDLESLNLKLMNDFQKNIRVLGQYSEFSSVLRRAIFTLSFLINKNDSVKNFNEIDVDQPTLEDIEWVLNFVEHTTNKETFSKFFSDPAAAARFKEVVNVRALADELARAQNQDNVGTKPYQFIPSRGLMLEFSGHVADACWSDKYASIGKKFPHITAVTMVQNPGSRDERLAGACLLVEGEDAYGRQLLIIRGFDPIENVINTLSVEDFYDKFTAYVSDLAAKTGRHPAIVIDSGSGSAGTNRPVLYDFMSKNCGASIPLLYDPSRGFNGYNIRGTTHELRQDESWSQPEYWE